MFRKPTGAILCPRCGRLTHPEAAECLVCGLPRPGRWLWAAGVGRLLRTGNVTGVVTAACVVLYVATLLIDPVSMGGGRGSFDPFSLFSPSSAALAALGGAGAIPWHQGYWWTLFTATYLHGGVLHILFNVLWIRQLGPAVEELYGRSRLVIILIVSGALGFFVSTAVGTPLTVGASAAIFGLLGAMVAYGKKRGGTFGKMVLREYGLWAVMLFAFGLMPGSRIDNWAHGGGFIGGFIAGLVLSFTERRDESMLERALAFGLIALTVLGFGLSVWTAFIV
jgi:membrane associated rhomboid family serine protease